MCPRRCRCRCTRRCPCRCISARAASAPRRGSCPPSSARRGARARRGSGGRRWRRRGGASSRRSRAAGSPRNGSCRSRRPSQSGMKNDIYKQQANFEENNCSLTWEGDSGNILGGSNSTYLSARMEGSGFAAAIEPRRSGGSKRSDKKSIWKCIFSSSWALFLTSFNPSGNEIAALLLLWCHSAAFSPLPDSGV